jgi:hypothetical protein
MNEIVQSGRNVLRTAAILGAVGVVGVAGMVAYPVFQDANERGHFISAVEERATAVAANNGEPKDLSGFTYKEDVFSNASSLVYEAAHQLDGNRQDGPTKKHRMAAGCLALTLRGVSWGKDNAQRWLKEQYTDGSNSCRDKLQKIIDDDPIRKKDPTHQVTFRYLNGRVTS